MNLSLIGIIHTIFGVVGVLTAFYLIFREGKINPQSPAGLVYFISIAASSILVFFLPHMLEIGFNPGHILTILSLASLGVGFFIRFTEVPGRQYLQALGLSASLFFTMIPTVKETLTRLPIDSPFAASEKDPLVMNSFAALFVLFVAFCVVQTLKIRKASKTA